ncbi:hypothetical protein COCC4DRAFT_122321 [Bipolaris maydis ATCC 48331]|uniref:Uncharacterized protein n=2 Tax=Cochliobolus heterostrophus TaxID=5016 RepID=M2V7Z9_COCH5|nr:uncharacterized protein COCC4DRAFT_122321 [Bipolaris maydis ATCC 48331]EMD95848.1 hypothetical protein COCHEDRAFT_1088118 [Bipolaris maydis C5]ENI10708.1 hypothetical protein COCC4DRAFT_122321 [Bipolaris maydis ATCC 48331]KAJ6213364.1 hypothetical protein PSV09DRAFT_1088118 [Bipolaris maydis]
MIRDRAPTFVMVGALLTILPIGLSILAVCLHKRWRVRQRRKRDALAASGEGLGSGDAGKETAEGDRVQGGAAVMEKGQRFEGEQRSSSRDLVHESSTEIK